MKREINATEEEIQSMVAEIRRMLPKINDNTVVEHMRLSQMILTCPDATIEQSAAVNRDLMDSLINAISDLKKDGFVLSDIFICPDWCEVDHLRKQGYRLQSEIDSND